MSRYYRMVVRVSGYNPKKQEAIQEAMKGEWEFNSFGGFNVEEDEDEGPILVADGEDSLYGGESEEMFAERMAEVIWEANGCKCKVEVTAYCLEYIPSNDYEPSYEEWLARQKHCDNE